MSTSEHAVITAGPVVQARDDHGKPRSSLPDADEVERHQISTTEDPNDLPLYPRYEFQVCDDLDELAALIRDDGEGIPITAYQHPNSQNEAWSRRGQLVKLYFESITKADIQLLSSILDRGLVTPETTNEVGRTPLLAAVEAEKATSVRFLIDAKADINAYGIVATRGFAGVIRKKKKEQHTYRTPLQYAAQLGNMTIVKVLMENGADDALIAKDGQLALRLAATNGHREIVDYLPRRRGGGFKRWKAKHATAMRRCKEALDKLYIFGRVLVWEVPRFFFWSIPKHVIVLPIVNGIKWLHAHRAEIPHMIVEQMKKLWSWLKEVPAAVWKGVKNAPGAIWRFAKGTASFLADCVKGTWSLIKRLPNAMKIALVWVWTGIKKAGSAVGHMFARLFSFLHLVCAAIANFFRQITLKDVWRGFVRCLQAVFVDAPKKMWQWLCSFGEMSLKVFEAMFGCIGWMMWELIQALMRAIVYVPARLGEILMACGGSIKAGVKEIMVWFDPKRI